MTTDSELLLHYVRKKSEVAFAELVQRHVAMVYSAALRQLGGDTHLAADVSQEVFTALARKAHQLSTRASIAGWLYLGTHHAAAQTIRSLRRRRAREQEVSVMHEILGSENSSVPDDWARVRPVLDEAMRQLGETDREAVLLRYFAQRRFEEIGTALNLSADAARVRVDRAIDKLRRVLERRGITSTGAVLATMLGNSAACTAPAGLAAQVSRVALTGASGVGTIGPLQFLLMNTPTLAAGVVAVAGIGLAALQFAEVRRVEARNDELERNVVALRAEVNDAQARAKRAGEAKTSLLSSTTTPMTMGFAASPQIGALPPPRQAVMSFRSADGRTVESMPLATDPEGRRQQTENAARHSYAALFRRQGWSKVQREQFVALFVERKERGQRLIEAAQKQGTTVDGTFAQVVWDQSGIEFDERLLATLGENSVAALREFEATKAVRNIADSLARDLFYSETPLSAEQAEQFIDAIAAVARTSMGKIDLGAVEPAALFAQASTVPSESQLAAFKQHELQRRRLANSPR